MTKFEKACEMSFNDWIATFPDEIPEAEYTDKHEKWLKILFNKMRDNKYHTFTTKTVKLLLIAAIVSAFFLTAFAIPSSREFIIENFDIFSTYTISEPNDNSVNGEIEVGYIPEGFGLKETSVDRNGVMYKYVFGENITFKITKHASSVKVDFNTENVETENIVVNNITYIYCLDENKNSTIIWNKNDYIYRIDGQLSKEEILKVAESVK